MAGVFDMVFQVVVFKMVHPLETLFIAVSLSILPYAIVRGLINRVKRLLGGTVGAKGVKVKFDLQPTLNGKLLILRPLRLEDYDALYLAASDPQIWEQHPNSAFCWSKQFAFA